MMRVAFLSLLLAGSASAQPASIASNNCAAPADFTVPADKTAEADDLNPWRDAMEGALLFRNEDVAETGLILRVFPDPASGEALAPLPEAVCLQE